MNRYTHQLSYRNTFLTALILAQLISIAALNIEIKDQPPTPDQLSISDIAQIELPPATKDIKVTPPPIMAPIPAQIPDDSPIDAPPIDFESFDDFSSSILPPPPIEDDKTDDIPFIVESMPKMKGGIKALYGEINYPEMAKRNGIEGMVVVEFIVNEKGEVVDPEIIREIGGGCDEEVLRAIKLQKFSPGVQNGKLVKVRVRQAVRFRLQ